MLAVLDCLQTKLLGQSTESSKPKSVRISNINGEVVSDKQHQAESTSALGVEP